MTQRLKKIFFLLFALILFFWSLSTGLPELGLGALWDVFCRLARGEPVDAAARAIFFDLRLPRAALALAAGAGLALAGAGTQAALANPLVSPSILGLTSGASFGASLVILYGGEAYFMFGRPLIIGAAFGGAIIAVCCACALASFRRVSKETLILAGIAVSFVFAAGVMLLQYLAPYQDLRSMVFWTMGSLWNADFQAAGLLTLADLLVLVSLLFLAPRLNALALGEEGAQGVGVEARSLRLRVLILCAFASACIVSWIGAVGFVDLVAPHLARGLLGTNNRRLLPGAMITGALLLLAADTAARTLAWPGELPVGVMTALLGGPFLLFLILRRKTLYP